MKNREIGEPIEYEIIYKDKIVPAREKLNKYANSPREKKKTYRGGFITMTIAAFLTFVLGIGVVGYLIIDKPEFLFPPAAPTTYSVMYRNNTGDDIETLETFAVKKGSTRIPEYQGRKPSRSADSDYIYRFNNDWDLKGVLPVSADVEMLAVYEKIPKKPGVKYYPVKWMSYDKDDQITMIKQDEVEEGTILKYDEDEPTRKANSDYTYKFKGWKPSDEVPVYEPKTYVARFDSKAIEKPAIEHHVKWLNYDDTGNLTQVLDEYEVKENERPSYIPPTPERNPDNGYTYKFKAWEPDIKQVVTQDTTYIPSYTPTPIKRPDPKPEKYLVQWKDADSDGGRIWQSEQIEDGKTAEYKGKNPYKISEPGYRYKFTEWDKTPSAIHSDTVYTARYDKTIDNNDYGFNGKTYALTGSSTTADSISNIPPLFDDGKNGPERVTTIGDGNKLRVSVNIKKVEIPPFIEVIEKSAFDSFTLYDFEVIFLDKIHSQLKTIKERSFAGYKRNSIDLPDSVEVIERNAFIDSWLTSFRCPDNLKVLNEIFSPAKWDSMNKFTIGKNVKEIRTNAIWLTRHGLNSIYIPKSVEIIDKNAIMLDRVKIFSILLVSIYCETFSKPPKWSDYGLGSIYFAVGGWRNGEYHFPGEGILRWSVFWNQK